MAARRTVLAPPALRPPALGALLALGLLFALAGAASAQGADDQYLSHEYRIAGWNYALDSVEQGLASPELADEALSQMHSRLQEVLRAATESATAATAERDRVQSLLDALGPPPDDPQSIEEPRIASERERLRERVATVETRKKQAELSVARASQLIARVSEQRRARLAEALLARGPSPLSPTLLGDALVQAVGIVRDILTAPLSEWMPKLASADAERYRQPAILAAALWGLLVYVGYRARRALLRRFVRDHAVAEPGYRERVKAAAAAAVARGVIPVVVAGLPLLLLHLVRDRTGLFADLLFGALAGGLMVSTVNALGRATLAPYSTAAWRLIPLADETARMMFRRTVALAAVLGVVYFIEYPVVRNFELSQELIVAFNFVVDVTVAVYLVLLMQPALWASTGGPQDHAEATEDEREDARARADGRRLWTAVRMTVMVGAFAVPVAAVMGYARLARYLATNLASSVVLVGALLLVHRLARDVASLAIAGDADDDDAGGRSSRIMAFWLVAAFDLVLVVVAALLLLPLWGVPWQDLADWLLRAALGIQIGSFTLSLGDLLVAVLLFIGILLVTRMLQRVLEERVFPATRLDTGLRNSLKTAAGYAGLVLAAGMAVSALGLDLSQLAIVLGALSVGIGFGLQNVVNNFVSGLILLVERPVKVGDWVVVGGHTGYVKRINVRATELQTFQLASVIIPNSELISASLTNWTHKDTLARVEVPVSVHHHADVEAVREALLGCARAHERVRGWPEPHVLLLALGPSSLDFELRVFISQADYMVLVASELRFAIHQAFAERGLRLAYPQLDVHLNRGGRLRPAGTVEVDRPPSARDGDDADA